MRRVLGPPRVGDQRFAADRRHGRISRERAEFKVRYDLSRHVAKVELQPAGLFCHGYTVAGGAWFGKGF